MPDELLCERFASRLAGAVVANSRPVATISEQLR